MNLIGLRTNFNHVHHVAQLYLRGQSISDHLSYLELRKWRDSDDCDRALWHANELIKVAENIQRRSKSPQDGGESTATLAVESFIEAPHIPFCIYLASLTLWAESMARQKPALDSATAHLESGVRILDHLKVRISQVLKRVLRRLIKATDKLL
jgi:hypothetical protein